ncbi:DUF7344 domain-containing protein [Halobaculum magnesiiphilum]|uniref:DUF7344 domain-containing protein n=1 Tax=Halobaculum magnesiiphilum TaxID=1017351 RepID=A0A8T8WI90_9EURY|nr:hypothetical protein [Halobaculum magnesiiphilum]QZP39557.1 hypothetical protein K6T50_18495 [Halobaculum magnesiiphilum]
MVSERGQSEDDDLNESSPSDSDIATGDGRVSIDPAILELDHVFSALSNPRRRYVMYALAENSEWILDALATKLAAWEEDVDEATVDANRRDRVYVSLYHTHVPKLVDEDIVAFDSETETITRAEHAEQVLAMLAGAGGSLDHAQEHHAGRAYDSDPGTDRNS